MVLVPLDLTYVQFTKHDNLGKLCALLSQTPPFLLVTIATLCLRGRELGTFTFFVGLLMAAGVSSKLKHLFHEPRPAGFGLDHQEGYEHGLPSSHSVFCFFAASYVCLWSLSGRWREPSFLCRLALAAASLGLAACVAAARVYLHYHFASQVAVGGAIGCVLGAVWFLLTERLFRPLFPALAQTPLCTWLRIRDASALDVLREEFEALDRFKST